MDLINSIEWNARPAPKLVTGCHLGLQTRKLHFWPPKLVKLCAGGPYSPFAAFLATVALATSDPSPGRDIYICKKAPTILTIHISLHAPSASSRSTAERARVVGRACWRRQLAVREEEEAKEKEGGRPPNCGLPRESWRTCTMPPTLHREGQVAPNYGEWFGAQNCIVVLVVGSSIVDFPGAWDRKVAPFAARI